MSSARHSTGRKCPHMVKRFAYALVAAATTATPLAAAPSAAYPDPTPPSPEPEIVSISANPDPLVLRPYKSGTVTVYVKTKDVKDVKIDIAPGGGGYGDHDSYGAVRAADPWNPNGN